MKGEAVHMGLRKIAVITPGSFPIPSGFSSSVERVVEYMVGLASDRVEARIYAKKWKYQEPFGDIRGVPCERIKAVGTRMYVRGVIRSLARFKPDIIQVENRPRFVLAMKRSFPHKRIWLSMHSTTFMSRKNIPPKLLRSSLRAADRIIVNSNYLYHMVARVCPECASRIIVNWIGVDGEQFRSRWSEEMEKRRIEVKRLRGWDKRDIIMYVGRLIPLKGVYHLLKSVPRVIARHPQALFIIIGSARYGLNCKTDYVRKLKRLGRKYPRHVKFVPYVSYRDIPNWYTLADIVVVPSVTREAFGLVNLEAMASGVPVLATRVGGIREVVVDGVTGVLVPPNRLDRHLARELSCLLDDESRRREMGESGIKHVHKNFTWQNTAQRWADEICAT